MSNSNHCSTLVLTTADAAVHVPGRLEKAMASLDGRWKPDRYDLLTVSGLSVLSEADDASLQAQVRVDIETALKLHKAERVVVAVEGNPVNARRRIEKLVTGLRVKVQGCNLAMFDAGEVRPRELAVVCMDWRQHGEAGGLQAAIDGVFGQVPRNLLSLAGGAKELGQDTPRAIETLRQIRAIRTANPGIKRVILTVHTDCGKYGGDGAFRDGDAQHDQLSMDLAAAAGVIADGGGCAMAAVIVRVADGKTARVERIRI